MKPLYIRINANKKALENSITALETKLTTADATNKKALENSIDSLKKALEKADADAKTEIEGQIASLTEELKTADATNRAEIEAQIAALQEALEKADADNLKLLQDSIASLNTNLTELIDANAKNIDALEATAADLQSQINVTNTKIDNTKTELEGKISDSEKNVLGQLNTLKTDIEGKLTTVNNEITALKAKDTELEGKIGELKTYVDGEIADTENWANETFSTLAQYQETQNSISVINGLIEVINQDIVDIKENVNTQVEAINKSIADLDKKYADKVAEVTKGYENAVTKAEEDITDAYTSAISTAITASETSMKEWVNKTLADGYYTIAEIDAKIDVLNTKDNNQQDEIGQLEKDLAQAQTDLTAAYQQAITDAITENNGKITAEITAAVKTAQDNLQAQIDAINTELASIKSRLDNLESDVESLKAQIQSVTFVPLYTDGAVKMAKDTNGNPYAFFDFRISPMAAAETLTVDDLLMEAIYVTDASQRGDNGATVTTLSLPVLEVKGSAKTGIITVKVSGANLSDDFFNGKAYASAVLTIKTGNGTEIVSDYVPMVAHSEVWTDIVYVTDWQEATLQGGEAEEQSN